MREPNFEFRFSLSGTNEHSLLYRDDKIKCQCEVHTPVDPRKHYSDPNRFGKQEVFYYIEGDKRRFRDYDAFVRSLNLKWWVKALGGDE